VSEIPLGSSYLRFFDQGGAVDEPKFVDEPINRMADIGGANTPLQDVPTPIVADPVFNPDNVQIDIPEFYPDLENPVDIPEFNFEPDLDYALSDDSAPMGETPSAYEELVEADLRLRLEEATPLERHLYEVTGMEPGLDRATILPVSGSKEGKDLQWSMPSLFYDLAKVANAPGAVVQGIPVSDDETVELGMNMMGSGLAIGPSVEGAVAGMAVKNRAGNWLQRSGEGGVHTRSPKGFTESLKARYNKEFERGPRNPEHAEAMEDFIDSKVERYIQRDFATPEDPVLRLAEEGLLPKELDEQLLKLSDDSLAESAASRRARHGFPAEGSATTASGTAYENQSDTMVYPTKAQRWENEWSGDDQKLELEQNPWMADLDPDTMVHEVGNYQSLMPFYSVLVKAEKGMGNEYPEVFRITQSDLDKMSLPQLMQKVAKLEGWEKTQLTKAKELALHEDTPRRFRRSERDMGDKGYLSDKDILQNYFEYKAFLEESTKPSSAVSRWRDYEAAPDGSSTPNERDMHWVEIKLHDSSPESVLALDKVLEAEGALMGHSVGDYVSTNPTVDGYGIDGMGMDAFRQGRVRMYSLRDGSNLPHATVEVRTNNDIGGFRDITQIKGKGNKAAVDKYQPYIEDFIQTQDWGKVRDLHLTNLTSRDSLPYHQLTDPRLPPDQKYFSHQELYDMFEPDAGAAINPEGFSHGGEVSKTAWEEINGY
jgi:hypothetical protein